MSLGPGDPLAASAFRWPPPASGLHFPAPRVLSIDDDAESP